MSEEAEGKTVLSERRPFSSEASLNVLINPERELALIEKSLKGGYLQTYFDSANGKTKSEFISSGKPLVNSQGVQSVMTMATSIINKNVVFGNLTGDEINKIMMRFHQNLASMLMRGYQDFEIKNINDYHTIISVVTNFARIFLSRTKDGIDRELLTQTQQTVETIQTGDRKRRFF